MARGEYLGALQSYLSQILFFDKEGKGRKNINEAHYDVKVADNKLFVKIAALNSQHLIYFPSPSTGVGYFIFQKRFCFGHRARSIVKVFSKAGMTMW